VWQCFWVRKPNTGYFLQTLPLLHFTPLRSGKIIGRFHTRFSFCAFVWAKIKFVLKQIIGHKKALEVCLHAVASGAYLFITVNYLRPKEMFS
jgi:hypothetical protein